MKVICAGVAKTGTKSLNAALRTIGYSVFDFTDHFFYHGDQWLDIFDGKGSLKQIKSMYNDVDAIVDAPAYFFWREILTVFPDSKIILSVRENEQVWLQSLLRHLSHTRNDWWFWKRLQVTRLGRKWLQFKAKCDFALYGILVFTNWASGFNEIKFCQHYRRQLADVMQNAPKDQLLVFNCKEGWEPLCNFLGVPVPEGVPFPHSNVGQKKTFLQKYVKSHPLWLEISQEFFANIFIFLSFLSLIVVVSISYWMFS